LNQNLAALNCIETDQLVVLTGGGDEIYFNAPYRPEPTWTSYTIKLDETAAWYHVQDNTPVTQGELLNVLGGLSKLKIRGWFTGCYREGPTAGLDTVSLNGPDSSGRVLTGVQVRSTFATDDEGWTVAGDNFGLSGVLERVDAEGGSGAHLLATGTGPWYWLAPPKFLGDASAAYQRRLKFDLQQSMAALNCIETEALVELNGGGYAICFNAAYGPEPTWTSFTVWLDETELWYHVGTTNRVSREELQALLKDLSQIKIRGWFTGCYTDDPTAGLDNVVLDLSDDPTPPPSAPQSAFDADAEGWTVAGGGFGLSGPLTWNAAGGDPDGYVSAIGDGAWYWLAPPAFQGDASAAYGKNLKFDLRQSMAASNCIETERLVVLDGGGYAIYFDAPYKPEPTWTSYAIRLHETELWYHARTGQRLTQLELQAVLADLSQVKIRGWVTGCYTETPTGDLDNVVLELK
jgi:hypothetical protein